MFTETFWDVETKNLFSDVGSQDPAQLGVSIVSVYTRTVDKDSKEINGVMNSFWEDDFGDMWELFSSADRIIGFNTLGFDIPAMKPYAPESFAKLPHFDIMNKVRANTGRRIGLNSLAKDTLGVGKIDVGTNAVKYWRAGDPESLNKLQTYCEADVAITRDLYDYVLQNKKLNYTDKWNSPREIYLDFSYPPEAFEEKNQGSLF